ncbi:hypothetical protein GALMADRAFT_217526 [Galerina marginata CBS 339.88]|uniref:Uncharacterized protein n=1 Tax=Galerina marginata (strain CBS 339.88) TaxID=685588 RepID=A0A067S3V1_GALM3|nr:hypothetical protein GALMADRAFT_217526 [Galerina marginata CBS 339.88]
MSPEYDLETESLFTPAVQSRASRHKSHLVSEGSVTRELMMPPFNLPKQLAGAIPATQVFSTPLSTNKGIPVKSENLDWDEPPRPVREGKEVVFETPLPPQRVLRGHGKDRQIVFNFTKDDATENDSADDNDLDFRSPSKKKAMARMKKPLALPFPGLDSDSEDDTIDVRSPSKKITSALAQKPPPPALGLAPPKSTLVQTQTLVFLGFRYHILYNIPVCIECEFGFLFNSFVKHAREGAKVEYVWSTTTTKRGNWTKPRKSAHHHRSMPLKGSKFPVKGGRLTMTDDEVEALILEELRELGHDPEPHYHGNPKDQSDLVLWLPHDDQIGPVEGIRVFKNGFKCAEGACAREPFPYCSVTRGTMASHIRKEHPGKTPRMANFKKDISVQSICGNTNYNCFFEVRPGRLPSMDFQPHSTLSVPDAVLLEQQQLFGNILDSTGSDADLIDPAYHQVGMAQFWTRFDFRVIEPLQEIVMSQREGVLGDFYHIQQAVVATFFEICIHARTANSALLRLIMKGCNIGRLPRKERFTIPRTSTLSIYVTIELLLLRWLLYALENPILDRDGNPLFKFDVLQSKSLGDLIDGARNHESVKDLAPRVVQALHYLYFPSDPSRSALDVTIEPVGAFLAILCLTSEGAPRPVADVPHYCARLQFSIRGRGFHHLAMTHVTLYSPSTSSKPHVLQKPTVAQTKRKGKAQQTTRRATRNNPIIESEESESESESEDSSYSPEASVGNVGTMMLPAIQTNAEGTNWWDATAKPWCGKYLTEDEPTPYAHARDTMRVFSAALRNRRKRAQVRWIDDERFLLDNNMINLQLYRAFIHSSLESLESFFCQNLLFGNTLESLGIRIDFNSLPDNGDTTTLGYSPLLGDTGMKGNVDSDKVLRKFIEDGRLLSLKNGQLSWNGDEADEWIASIHEATCRTFSITHLTQGSAGRVTEEAKMLFSNTRTARRHIFVHPGLNTLCIWSNYWKGTQKSGTFKEILRVIPHRPSRLILILLRILRPIALMYLGKHRFVGKEGRGELLATYSSSLWASLGAVLNERLMYRSLREFYAAPGQDGTTSFDFIFGARLHRQFVVTVQRKHIPGSLRYTPEVAKSKESIGDKQAGRSSQTSTQNYSVVESVIDQDPGFIEHYIEYSKKWHQYLELSTEPGENDIYLV